MIKIKLVTLGEVLMPERFLTQEENLTITSTLFNGVYAIYYQGDEPPQETFENTEIIE